MSDPSIKKSDIAYSFGRAANKYDQAAHFQRYVGDELMMRTPQGAYSTLVDLGCGTGHFANALIARSNRDDVNYLGLDIAVPMLSFSRQKLNNEKLNWLAADFESLPLKHQSVDLFFSSLAIQWCRDLNTLFSQIVNSLKPGGVFTFSTLLDGTLRELQSSWSRVDSYRHVNSFFKFHDYESVISGIQCLEVVKLERESHTLEYHEVRDLTRELKLIGAHNMSSERPSGLTGRQRIKGFVNAYESHRMPNGLLPASYEILYGVVRKHS